MASKRTEQLAKCSPMASLQRVAGSHLVVPCPKSHLGRQFWGALAGPGHLQSRTPEKNRDSTRSAKARHGWILTGLEPSRPGSDARGCSRQHPSKHLRLMGRLQLQDRPAGTPESVGGFGRQPRQVPSSTGYLVHSQCCSTDGCCQRPERQPGTRLAGRHYPRSALRLCNLGLL